MAARKFWAFPPTWAAVGAVVVLAVLLAPIAIPSGTPASRWSSASPWAAGSMGSALPRPGAHYGAGPGLSSSWPFSLALSTNVSAVCAYGGDRCPAAPATVRVQLSATAPNETGNNTTAAQVLFVLDVSPMTVCSDLGDCLAGFTGAVPVFRNSTDTFTHRLAAAHPGVNVSFALAVTSSSPGLFDDGDSLAYQVPVPNFVNATNFGPTVNRSFAIPGDIDASDNPLQTDVTTALYGAFLGLASNSTYGTVQNGPVNWTNGADHVVVWVGATAPADANYTEYYCPLSGVLCGTTTNSSMSTCEPSGGLTVAMPTCEGWITSQNGHPLDSIAALARSGSGCLNSSTGHCTVDSVIVNATSTDPASSGWRPTNLSGQNRTDVLLDAHHVVAAGCDLSLASGGSWDGPRNSTCGNVTGNLGAAGRNATNAPLVDALSNVSLGGPIGPAVGSPVVGASMFRFVTTPEFTAAPDLNAVATCSSSSGPLPGCPQEPSLSYVDGRTVLGWNWTNSSGHPSVQSGDRWSVSFNLVASGGPVSASLLDECTTTACAALENGSGGSPYSGVEFAPWGLPTVWNESFPALTVDVVAAPALAGSLIAPVTEADAPSSLSFQITTNGGYPPFTVLWAFGDGTTGNSTSLSIAHTYATSGFFHLGAVIRDAGHDEENFSRWITILPSLVDSINESTVGGSAPLTVSFSANPSGGLGPYVLGWSFGDGATATGLGAVHTFGSPGTYVVQASVTDALGGTSTAMATITVDSAAVLAAPLAANGTVSASEVGSCANARVQFQFRGVATGGSSPYSFLWEFGDGTTAYGPSVTHEYASPPPSGGVSTPTLVVSDSAGSTVRADVPLPVAVFAGPSCPPATSSGGGIPSVEYVGAGVAIVAAIAVVLAVVMLRPRRPAA